MKLYPSGWVKMGGKTTLVLVLVVLVAALLVILAHPADSDGISGRIFHC